MKKSKETYDLIVQLAQLTNFEKQVTLLTLTVKHTVDSALVTKLTNDVYVGIKQILTRCQSVLPVKIYANIKWNKKTEAALEPLFALLYSEVGFDQLSLLRDMLSKDDLLQLLLAGEAPEMVEILSEYGQIFSRVAKEMTRLTNVQTTLSETERLLEKKSELSSYKMVLKPEILPMAPLEQEGKKTEEQDWGY